MLTGSTVSGTVMAGDTAVNVADVTSNRLQSLSPAVASKAVGTLKATLRDISKYRNFAAHLSGDSVAVKLENDLISLDLSSKGGVISRAELKKYEEFDSSKVVLFDGERDNIYSFTLTSESQRFDTRDFYFNPVQENDSTVLMTLDLGKGASWGIRYTLPKDSYVVKMDIVQSGMQAIVPSNTATMDFYWHRKMRRHEEGRMFEERNSAIYYKYAGGSVENLNEGGDDDESTNERVRWIGFKNQFFSSVIIPANYFTMGEFESKELKGNPVYLKDMTAVAAVEYSAASPNPASFSMFFGPNLYPLLDDLQDHISPDENLELTRLIPLGWALFRWINTYIIIPVFDLLGRWISNYGIIILLLTVFIKLIIFPFTYKSYMSQAKMRVLAPDIKEINDKYPGQENAMVRQQKTMALYSSAGASPLSGCLPMLMQMPVLIAMFTFFPSCIELRGKAFLWAKDLSAPDAIISWNTHIPFISDYFGNHISLFCLLMTVTNIIYTRINMQNQPGGNSMPGMKMMMYLMPIMFLVFFNNYAAGLSYYYFLSLLITIVQTYAFRRVVDEEKVRATMRENAKKPKKKSGFMARLEEAQRQQQAMLREQEKRKKQGGRR
ncbi:MAG: membrane protein insertase YidC [Muribaculaceae bacterium]